MMQLPSKTNWYFLLTGFGIAVALFIFLTLKGCFSVTTSSEPKDTLSVTPEPTEAELTAKPLSVEGQKTVTKWKTNTIHDTLEKEITVYNGGDCKDFEHEDTIHRTQTITIKQGSKRTDYAVEENLPMKQIVGCSVGRSLLTLGSSHSEIEIPEITPISTYREPFIEAGIFGEFDLVNDKEWRIGIELDINLGALGIYTAPNVNPDNVLALPVGATYTLWEK